jgi:uncharacterized membrane protein
VRKFAHDNFNIEIRGTARFRQRWLSLFSLDVMSKSTARRMSLFGGIVFIVAGLTALLTGGLQSATVPDFRVSGDAARFVGVALLIVGSILLFDWLKKRRSSQE